MKSQVLVKETIDIRSAMKQMDKSRSKILFVVDDRMKIIGSLSDGDVRRWILANGDIRDTIKKVFNPAPKVVMAPYDIEAVKKLMLSKQHLGWIPVVDQEGVFQDLLTWDQVFSGQSLKKQHRLKAPVIIMAGGKGERLDPFTKILPKALIPINDEPMIEIIMKKFMASGVSDFHVAVLHKAKMIRAYFEEQKIFRVKFIEESKPLGTAGALRLLKDRLKGDFFVTNCDVLIDADYAEILALHRRKKNALTLVSSCKHFVIPYGVCSLGVEGDLKTIDEKPEYSLLVNTGMYVVNARALSLIPADTFFHMTDLIRILKEKGERVGVYPISEDSWIDTGEWPEFQKALHKLQV